jgi:hypothetical protein
MMQTIFPAPEVGLFGIVVRERIPLRCRQGFCTHRGMSCETCPARTILKVVITFRGKPALDAITAGLVTPEEVEKFRKEITGVSE